MDRRIIPLLVISLIVSALVLLFLGKVTREDFFLDLAAIPLEVLLVIFFVDRLLERRSTREKRRQPMFIKSHLFRAEMKSLFIRNFNALKYPALTMSKIRYA